MDDVRQLVPHFMQVRGDQPAVIAEHGYPVDVVPVSHTRMGERVYGPQPIVFQSCSNAAPARASRRWKHAVRACGAKVVYRGQRNEERRRARIEHGHVDEFGITLPVPAARLVARAGVRVHAARSARSTFPPTTPRARKPAATAGVAPRTGTTTWRASSICRRRSGCRWKAF